MELYSTMNLYQARSHSLLKLLDISGGWRIRRSLNQLGIHAGDHVHVLRKAPFGGPVVVRSRGGEVAIGRQLAEKLKVQVIP